MQRVSQSFSQLTVFPSSALLSFTLPWWLIINPIVWRICVVSIQLHYLSPMVPEAFWPLLKSPSVLENILPVAGDFRFRHWMSWLANIYWVLMIWPAPFYADYMRDRGKYSSSMFSTLLILTTWLWSKIASLFFPSRWAMSTIPISACCICQGDSCHKVTGLLYLMSGF